MELERIAGDFSICKLADASLINLNGGIRFASMTDEEISLACPSEDAPRETIARDDGWRAFRVRGTLDFALVGILAKISAILADGGIGLFAVSTYNTDYILTKAENYERALASLEAAGYTVL